MDISRLVAMANDIAAFFQGEGDPAAAGSRVADHLRRFWDPRMRSQLIAHARAGGAGLDPIALEAVRLLTPRAL